MRIEHARRKRANDITADLERLVDWRRLMHCAGDWFKILRVKRERIEISVPTDRIERMLRQRDPRKSRSVFHENIDIFLFIDRNYFPRTMKVALRVRRAHFNLPLMVQITLRYSNRTDRFQNEIILFFNLVRHEPVSDASGNDNVILGSIRKFAEHRLHHAATV